MNMKASLLKDKKLTSEKLRIENQKMELRLQQLKLAMSKEKEERLSNGTKSNWTTGCPGAILNYKPNISRIESGKKLKLKMLKEETTVVPASVLPTKMRSTILRDAMGTDGSLFGKNDSNSDRNTGGRTSGSRHCGQCEDYPAAVNCKECAEDYCPKCFAAFHLKGALRKHRSTPISNLNSRISIPSPLFKPPDMNNLSNQATQQRKTISPTPERKNKKYNLKNNENADEMMDNSKENELPTYLGVSLAEGKYNEELSNQYFQEAVNAWRKNVDICDSELPVQKLPTTEHSTETIINNKEKKLLSDLIQFTPSLSYAEQLLLRKHRNNQLIPDDMRYILNRLTKTNEEEFQENKKLMESNLVLEKSLIDNSTENAVKTVQYHIDFESVNQLIKDAESMKDRHSSLSHQIVMESPFKIEELIDHWEDNETKEKLPLEIELNCNSNAINTQIEDQTDTKLYIQSTVNDVAIEEEKLDNNPRRSKSAINRKNFYDRPSSAKKMSARHSKGGGNIITKPSVLLNMLANFNNYLPSPEQGKMDNVSKTPRPSSSNASKSSNKISFNFYKLSPNSWKPDHSWLNKVQHDLHDTDRLKNISSFTDDKIDDDIAQELINLNLLSHKQEINATYPRQMRSFRKSSVKSSNSDIDNDNLLDNTDLDYEDEEAEAKETFEKLNSLERELTIISRQSFESLRFKCDEIITDSLDCVTNGHEVTKSMDSDKFCFEDSLDFHQRYSKNSGELPERDTIDEEDGMGINCSSRFDDCEDVYKLN